MAIRTSLKRLSITSGTWGDGDANLPRFRPQKSEQQFGHLQAVFSDPKSGFGVAGFALLR